MLILHSNFYKDLAAWRNATGLSVPSPRPTAHGQRVAEFIPIFLAGGFPLLSLAGVQQKCSSSISLVRL